VSSDKGILDIAPGEVDVRLRHRGPGMPAEELREYGGRDQGILRDRRSPGVTEAVGIHWLLDSGPRGRPLEQFHDISVADSGTARVRWLELDPERSVSVFGSRMVGEPEEPVRGPPLRRAGRFATRFSPCGPR
jgi:hypothetical protein